MLNSKLVAPLIDSVASSNLTEAVKYLEEGADPNVRSNEGATAMHIAAGVGVEALRLMLQYGGEPNVRSVDGSTPLHVAAAWGDKETLRLLLHNGANPNLFDHDGQRAVDVARNEDHIACVDLLKYYTMLVAIGDREEDPMYTAELLDPLHGDPVTHPGSSPTHLLHSFSEDEDSPVNLSDEYSAAVTQSLKHAMKAGKKVCLDVTSPDCPYVRDRPRRRSEIGPGIDVGDLQGQLLSDSDSETIESVVPKCGVLGCRCRICLSHGFAGPHLDKEECTHCHHFYDKVSASLCKSDAQVESKMKQKYFPLIKEGCCASETREFACCSHGYRIKPFKNIQHKYFSPLTKEPDLCHLSPTILCSQFQHLCSVHSHDYKTCSSGHCCVVSNHSPSLSCALSSHHSCHLPCDKKLHSASCQGESGLVAGHRTSFLTNSKKQWLNVSGPRSPAKVCSPSPTKCTVDSSSDKKCLQMQATQLCDGKPVMSKSPVTILPVLEVSGARFPSCNVFRKYGFDDVSDKQNLRKGFELTDIQGHDVVKVPSAISVDSGFSEQVNKSQVTKCAKDVSSTSLVTLSKKTMEKGKKSNDAGHALVCDQYFGDSRLNDSATDLSREFEKDDCRIISSNLGNKFHNLTVVGSPRQEREATTSSTKFTNGPADNKPFMAPLASHSASAPISTQKPAMDHSISSTDSYCTCQEGSESASDHTYLEPQSIAIDHSATCNNNEAGFSPDQRSNQKKTKKLSKRESLGFCVSQLSDATEHSSNYCKAPSECRYLGQPAIRNMPKGWTPPVEPISNDSDLYTSDGSFMLKAEEAAATTKSIKHASVNNVSKWLENLAVTSHTSGSEQNNHTFRGLKRMSDESMISAASSVQEYIYRDKENGITLIERHIPSEFSGSSGRPSLESILSVDTDETQSYDWTDFILADVSSSYSSFDVTAGNTLNSKEKMHDDVAVPPELAGLSDEAISQSLKALGEDPGPVLPSTRQTYLRRLASLTSGKEKIALTTAQPGYSSELNRLISGSLDMEDLSRIEQLMVEQFQTADGRTWREGTIKSCFNYLLLDPTITKNLPLRAKVLGKLEAFKTFLSAIFYIGKGKRSRPYCHLYEAIAQLKNPKPKVSKKVDRILDIWLHGLGVVSLHCFQNVIPVEAYTREACMVDAIGLGYLTNMKRGDYYGVASTWPGTRRRCVGAYLLHKAFHIFLSEGERQICPSDIQKGK